ncbi:MAG: class I SAM-dependent methyltransferase [Inquilinaceae bacterium]
MKPSILSVDDVSKVVAGYPHMSYERGRVLFDFIREHGIARVLELGCNHGISACYAAAAVANQPNSYVVTVDRLAVAAYRPGVCTFAEALDLQKTLIPFFERQSYNWRLRCFLKMHPQPVFDLIFIDGAHTFETDALAFILSERLLRPGGWFIFDDINWSVSSSLTARIGHGDVSLLEDEIEARQVRDVIDLMVRDHPGIALWREDGPWGFAQKRPGPGRSVDEALPSRLHEMADVTLRHARENFPIDIDVPPDLEPVAWRRTIGRGIAHNGQARKERQIGTMNQ